MSLRTALRKFLQVSTQTTATRSFAQSSAVMQKLDPAQEQLMNTESLILVDTQDNVTGKASKRDCHLVKPDGTMPLHRAFSIYLFNTKGEFLLQQRSQEKITFPALYTNTCCSHPLYIPDEMEMDSEAIGVKRAALRRVENELGVGPDQLHLGDLRLMTRMLYQHNGDGVWGEHEFAYLFVVKKDIKVTPNPNEVMDVRYIAKDDFKKFESQKDVKFTPWFSFIKKELLTNWWDNIDNFDKFKDDGLTHNFYGKM